ncbi:hypothetical protein BDM02DRAFT_3138676 [Thelephora ganbajun]|uniref:Uncharacterized protein n=1 Tax=Thelephora ganbajun TaxID=370292 RepID=A0ACB6ZPN9_THEGA|nr:hypothetical protein BDM02DRAFT_3138676 [Thelephora ganbajun]
MDSDRYLNCLEDFLVSPLPKSLLAAHPNDAAKPSFTLPPGWETWWNWAVSTPQPWVELLSYYAEQRPNSDIPGPLSQMIDNIKALQLTRSQRLPPVPTGYGAKLHEAQYINANTSYTQTSAKRMSPKKLHEVSAMTAHIVHLLRTSPTLKGVQHVVDIGAGRGYLSWNLRALGMHVLALDASDTQAKGAERQGSYSKSSNDRGSLTYQTAKITPSTLLQLVDEWIIDLSHSTAESHLPSVVFVALHACGSFTTDILRTSVSAIHGNGERRSWSLKAAIVVGCCYNMMEGKGWSPSYFTLSSSHLQLAAQVPSTWLDHQARTEVALRKVSWRALLEATTTESNPTDGCPTPKNRLGRVSNDLYQHWEQFLQISSVKLCKIPIRGMEQFPEKLAMLEKRISTLHALRCLLGSCVESLIIWDRYVWLKEVSGGGRYFEAHLLNLFDQRQASGRNISITLISN